MKIGKKFLSNLSYRITDCYDLAALCLPQEQHYFSGWSSQEQNYFSLPTLPPDMSGVLGNIKFPSVSM